MRYLEYAERCLETGFLIPIPMGIKDGKTPREAKGEVPFAWSKRDTFPESDWNAAKGIGIILKNSLGIVALDRDSKDPAIKEAIRKIIPPGYCVRTGDPEKDPTVFFQIDERIELPSRHEFKSIGVEILFEGSYCGISLLMDGKEYYNFPNVHILKANKDLMPILSQDIISNLRKLSESVKTKAISEQSGQVTIFGEQDAGRCRHGSYLTISQIMMAALSRGETREDVINEILRVDEENNKVVSMFLCKSAKRWKFKTREENAAWLVDQAIENNPELKSIPKGKITFEDDPEESQERQEEAFSKLASQFITDIDHLRIRETRKIFSEFIHNKELPQTFGIVDDLTFQIAENSLYEMQKSRALLISLTVLGNLVSQRYSYQDGLTSNIFSLLLGDSGSGKTSTVKFTHQLGEGPCGVRNDYDKILKTRDSATIEAFFKDLSNFPRPLMMYDEADELFNGNKKNFDGLISSLCGDLWDKQGIFRKTTKTSGTYGVCKNPRLSLLAITTTDAGEQFIATKEFLSKGIGRRVLIDIDTQIREKRINPKLDGKQVNDRLILELQKYLHFFLSNSEQTDITYLQLEKYRTAKEIRYWESIPDFKFDLVPLTLDAQKYLSEIIIPKENSLDYFLKATKTFKWFSPMARSIVEYSKKIALILAVFEEEDFGRFSTKSLVVDVRHLESAFRIVEYFIAQSFIFIANLKGQAHELLEEDKNVLNEAFNRLKNDFSKHSQGGEFLEVKKCNNFKVFCSQGRPKLKVKEVLSALERDNLISVSLGLPQANGRQTQSVRLK